MPKAWKNVAMPRGEAFHVRIERCRTLLDALGKKGSDGDSEKALSLYLA